MNEHRQNSSQRNYLSKNFIRKPIILSLKAIRRNTNWIVEHFTHLKAAEDINANANAKIRFKSYKTSI